MISSTRQQAEKFCPGEEIGDGVDPGTNDPPINKPRSSVLVRKSVMG